LLTGIMSAHQIKISSRLRSTIVNDTVKLYAMIVSKAQNKKNIDRLIKNVLSSYQLKKSR